jgi:hypothetical protein
MTNKEFIESVTLPGEEWRDVVGFEGYYMVSSFGRVISLSRTTFNGVSHYLTKPRIIKSCPKDNGYLVVSIYKEPQRRKTLYVHRMVAQVFCKNPYNKPHIDHINANKQDNSADNLRWVTQIENNRNPISSIKISLSKKGQNNAKLSHPIVSISEAGVITHYCSLSFARNMGLSIYKIIKCCKGYSMLYNNCKWMYLSDYEKLINKSKNSQSISTTENYPQSELPQPLPPQPPNP